jgi:translocation and assembly module TamA
MKFRFYLVLFCLLLLPVSGNAESLHLKIKCADKKLQKILEPALVLPPALISDGRINKNWLDHFQKKIPEKVHAILEPYGYFHSQVSSQIKEVKPGEYHLRVKVTPGIPLRITTLKLELTGSVQRLPEIEQLRKDFPLKVGDILRQDIYKKGKSALLQGVINLGYFDAKFKQHQILVDQDKRQINIILHIESNGRFRFGETTFKNHGDYQDHFLRRYITYKEGEYFSQTKLNQTRRKLRDANLFRSIEIKPLRDQATDHRIPISISLESAPRHQLLPGIGYGTDTGVRGSLRYRNRNLFHRGHEFEGDLRVSKKDQYFLTTYTIPDQDTLDRRTMLHAGIIREDNTSYESHKLFTEEEYQRSFNNELTGSLFIRQERERYWIGDDHSKLSFLLLPGARLSWRHVDNLLTPRQGIQTRLELKGGYKDCLSDISILRVTSNVTTIYPLPQQLSLLLRLRGGATWHSDSFSEVPASLRFFPGGGKGIRGYKYKSLGPKDNNGQVIGGKHQLIANIELEKKLNKDWGVVIFTDIGNSFNSLSEYHSKQGAGIGVNYYTVIGPVHIDIARPIGDNDKKNYRLSLSVGAQW